MKPIRLNTGRYILWLILGACVVEAVFLIYPVRVTINHLASGHTRVIAFGVGITSLAYALLGVLSGELVFFWPCPSARRVDAPISFWFLAMLWFFIAVSYLYSAWTGAI